MTRQEYIEVIRSHADEIRKDFGVTSMRLFGSVAREQHDDNSDVDVFVNMPPRLFKLVGLGRYLESLLGRKVDVIRGHSHMNKMLRMEIERDGIQVFN